MPNLFHALPTEILIRALSFLPGVDLESCKFISRNVRDIIDNSALLRYIIATDLARVEDNPHSNLSISEKYTTLVQRELSWRRFQPDFVQSIDVDYHPMSEVYDFTDGVYFIVPFNRPWLHYLGLSTVSSRALAWSHIQIGSHHTMIDMATAIYENDLIAIVTRSPNPDLRRMFRLELNFWSFRTGNIHPLASQPTILIELTSLLYPSTSFEIMGDLLALTVTHHDSEVKLDDLVSVWNWKTGTPLIRVNAPYKTHPSVTFLTEDILLVPNNAQDTFEFWRIPSSSGDDMSNPIHAIALPPLTIGAWISSVSCRGEPTPLRLSPSLNFDRPFRTSPQQNIIIFYICTESVFIDSFSLTLVVHRHSLVDLINKHLPQVSPEDIQQPLPWESWGPSIARWFVSNGTSTRWITRSAGQRFVSIPSAAAQSPCPITVYDFNPCNVAKMKNYLENRPNPNMFYNDREEELGGDAVYIFETPVRSALPYCGTRSERAYDYDGVLMDEERLLGIKIGPFNEVLSVDVMHFG
ncbi:hypothetical protein BD779DRAFT_1549491 [Infundibulicybe gibba]|nr:hypothetical protein BD779DRAFT_1549491 [Infundibulicybe gibba]